MFRVTTNLMSEQPNFIFRINPFRKNLLVRLYPLVSETKPVNASMHIAKLNAYINSTSEILFFGRFQKKYDYISQIVSIHINYIIRFLTPITKIQNNIQLHSK